MKGLFKKACFITSLSGILFLALSCAPASSDSSTPSDSSIPSDLDVIAEEKEKTIIPDKYRNMYQIFPASFADGNGDGRGDLQGIIDKLDYLDDLNYSGIWLTPIHPSATDHHYDVEDYKAVSRLFGDLATFDALVKKVHEKGMTIILDLVINHSSNQHEWFQDSYIMAKSGSLKSAEAKRYNWVKVSGALPSGYAKVNASDTVAYEARFDATMPDLNLQQVLDEPDGDLATDLKDIFSFWLLDHDVDGFRLDAVTSYFTGNQTKNKEMLSWINAECKKIKEDCYIVGEANWGSNSSENKDYQESGIDSFFQFSCSAQNTGYITQAVNSESAKLIATALQNNKENANGGIEAPFLGNHDTARYVGGVSGRNDARNAKFALGLLQQLGGATFTYYGDELGMASQSVTMDGFYRLPIRWGENDNHTVDVSKLRLYGVSASAIDDSKSYPHPDVATQLADPNSILNYAKRANKMRLDIPALARGDSKLLSSTDNAAIIERRYDSKKVTVVINASKQLPYEVDYAQYGSKILGELSVEGKCQYKEKDSTLVVMPRQSILVIGDAA